jgi:hypothetical protein
MAIKHACMRVVRKPWGSTDLLPWSEIHHGGVAIGELWNAGSPIRRFSRRPFHHRATAGSPVRSREARP